VARLDPTFAAADLGALMAQVSSLEAEVARHRAPRRPRRIPDFPGTRRWREVIRSFDCARPTTSRLKASTMPRQPQVICAGILEILAPTMLRSGYRTSHLSDIFSVHQHGTIKFKQSSIQFLGGSEFDHQPMSIEYLAKGGFGETA
jgi:hypothetical protein